MLVKVIDFGNSNKNVQFDMSKINNESWHDIAEDIVALVAKPSAVRKDTTSAKIIVRDNVAKVSIQFKSSGAIQTVNYSLDEFGCAEDSYCDAVSQVLQLYMLYLYGDKYIDTLDKIRGDNLVRK